MALTASTVTSRLFWNHFLKNSLSEHKTLFYGCIIQGTGAILITLSLVDQNYSLMLIGFSFMSFGSAFLIAIAGVSALYLFPDHKGQVGAIYGALQMVGAFGFTYILSLLPATQETIVICSWGVVLLSVVAFVVLLLRERKSTLVSEVLSN
ncbi:multidrug resistance protein D [Vibrio thalassae]|uniref:Multidrug resistance protein D n=1 Tax=Vibrio thalassae TaxID=1243014 RepID=A0A240EMS3_9VIBR|nr:hypothetical protein [Vibrio thalassae]SNX49904.1 multidrug resistance protein D [Vibrio thalassae]